LRAFLRITLPLIGPAVGVAYLFCFLTSFDEVVLATFITGPETATLPRKMWDGIRFELNPTIAAVSTLLIGTSER
jgi:ABC-type spermidine/putrescine transport system permease subunit II